MRLSRRAYPAVGEPWPVRVVHLGPGAFFRAHAAWCTWVAGDGWGIAAAGRSASSTSVLADQDGLCSVLVRGPHADELSVVGAISSLAATPGLAGLLRDPAVGVVTLTITEAGYQPGSPVLAALAAGLEERLAATGGAPLAVVSCDNVASNGQVLADRLLDVAPPLVGAGLTFPSTVVDRITPAATALDLATASDLLGLEDRAAVVTEPSLEWVLEDAFPAGRPAWERAGAQIVDDVSPWSMRKLRVLNAGHSWLAYAGGCRGHRWVHEAVADPVLVDGLRGLWAEAQAWMPPAAAGLVDDAYLDGLLDRWANARLPHALAQIATDGSMKLTQRVVPTLGAAGAAAPWSAAVVGAWVAHVRSSVVKDAGDLGVVVSAPSVLGASRAALAVLGVGDIDGLGAAVADAAARFGGS